MWVQLLPTGRAIPGRFTARPKRHGSAKRTQAPHQIACQATKQSGVGDVRPHASMLWSAPSLDTYVATATRKSERKSTIADQWRSRRRISDLATPLRSSRDEIVNPASANKEATGSR